MVGSYLGEGSGGAVVGEGPRSYTIGVGARTGSPSVALDMLCGVLGRGDFDSAHGGWVCADAYGAWPVLVVCLLGACDVPSLCRYWRRRRFHGRTVWV